MTETRGTARFAAPGGDEALRLILLLALGMCRALADGLVSPAYACHRLFGPALLKRAREAGGSEELVLALDLASELEAVADHVPNAYPTSLSNVEARLLAALALLPPPSELSGEKWLSPPNDR
jgi:hypothetical protein